MANSDLAGKFSVQHLDFMEPPLPASGGRIHTPAGELAQIVSDGNIRHLVYLELKADGKPRGNHHHTKVQSHGFYVIKGKLLVKMVDLGDGSRAEVTISTGDVMRIKPGCAHVFIALEDTQAIEFNNAPYDPADTIPYVVDSGKQQEG